MINNLYIKATPAAASITWGSITGTLSSQTDLQNALDAKFDDPTGTVSQYVRGDGSLANFPSSIGGGSSLTFYLNGSVAQGTFGGVAFKEMDRAPVLGAGTDFTIATNGYIQSFITDANVPNLLEIPAGNWNFETYLSASSSGGTPSFYIELYKWNGTTLSLIASNSATPEGITNGTSIHLYVSALAVPQTVLTVTDRLAVRIYVNNSGRTITLHTENSHLCEVITTFSTGLTALNGLTAQVQNLATGTSGTDFGISSATSTHTFNLPTASAANRGALSSADWTTFNGKQAALVSGTTIKTINGSSVLGSGNLVVGGGGGVTSVTGTAPVVSSGGTTPAISMAAATTSVDGYLTSTNFNTFNNKQAALVSGTNIKTVNGTSVLGSGNISIIQSRKRDIRVLGSYGYYSWEPLTNAVINVGDLLTGLSAPIDISLLVESQSSNLVVRMYLSSSPTTVAAGAQQIGQATIGPGTIRVGKFVRTLHGKYYVAYSGEETDYVWYNVVYINCNDISDASSVSGVTATADYQFNDYWAGTEIVKRYLVIQIPNGLYAWNLNVESGT